MAISSILKEQQAQASANNPLSGLDQNYQDSYNAYDRSLYAQPRYKGSHELNELLKQNYLDMLRGWQNAAPIDYSGESQIARGFGSLQNQLAARMAARGIGGSGVEAGGQASLYGQEGNTIGNYVRGLIEQRRQKQFQQQQAFDQWARALQAAGLQRNWQQQDNKGGFWKDLAGAAGTIGGALIGGPAGAAAGSQLGSIFGGNSAPADLNPIDSYGSPGGGSYGPVDPTQYYGPWDPSMLTGR